MPRPKKSSTPVTYYASTFDMIGGPYEFNNNNTFDPNFDLFEKVELFKKYGYTYVFTDDSVLTTAVARMVMETAGMEDDEDIITNGVINLKNFVHLYPNGNFPGGYGGNFAGWADKLDSTLRMDQDPEFNNDRFKGKSCGNGSGMRVSPVGWAYNTLEKTLKMAELTAMPSHSDPEGIKGAQAIAAAVYLSRAGVNKDDIKTYLETKFNYDLDKNLDAYRDYNRDELKSQSEVCPTTVPMAIRAFLEGDNYEDCGRKAITIGGDSDTIGAMTGSIAGAYYGMPKWLEDKCYEYLDDRKDFMRNEAKKFQEYIDSIDTEPNMDEIENALAKARLEKHFLQNYTSKQQAVLKEDATFVDLLAKKEATRLFFDELNAIRLKGDTLSEQALVNNKDTIIQNLTNNLKEQPENELLKAYGNTTECPVEMVKVIDYDGSKRKAGVAKSIPDQRLQINHAAMDELIPDRIVDNSNYQEFMTEEIEKAKAVLEKKNQVSARVKEITDRYYIQNKEKIQTGTKGFAYKNLIVDMIDEVIQYYPGKEQPKLVKDILNGLVNLGDTAKYEPINTGNRILKNLQTLSDELTAKAIEEESEELINKLALVKRLTDAVDDVINAPEDLHVIVTDKVINDEAERMDNYAAQQQDRYEKYTIAGQKTERYYNVIVNDLIDNEKLGECFELGNLPEKLKKAIECWKKPGTEKGSGNAKENAKVALSELEALSEQLNEKMLDDDSTKLMKQVTYVNHLMAAMDDAISAPEDLSDIDIHDTLYKHLVDHIESVGRVMDGIENKKGKAFELAKRAQEGLQNIKKAVADDFMNDRNDKALNALKKGDDYAAVFVFQNMQKFTAVAKLDPDKEPDVKKREAIREAVKDAETYLEVFEKQDLNKLLNELKKDKVYERFEKNLNIFRLNTAMEKQDGMQIAYMDTKKEIVIEEVTNLKEGYAKKDSNKKKPFEEYVSEIRKIEKITQNNPNSLEILKACGETVQAMLGHIAANDDKEFSKSNALSNDEYASKTIQDIVKKGSLAARKLNKAEKTGNEKAKQAPRQ